jgi:hypothetical protein
VGIVVNIRQRRDAQARRHAAEKEGLRLELEEARLHARLLADRVALLISSDSYQGGFHDGVTVGLQQLHLWLVDSRVSAKQVIATTPVDHDNPDFKLGHDLAAAWIDEAIDTLYYVVEERAHAVATGHQEDARGEDQGSGDGGVRASEQAAGGAVDPRVGG